MNKFLLILLLIADHTISGQVINGCIFNSNKQPIEFVNIGIAGQNVGTVSDTDGIFNLEVDSAYNNDSIHFSIIGYESHCIKIADLRQRETGPIYLKRKTYGLNEITVSPKKTKEKTLGIQYTNANPKKKYVAGFKHNRLGYECGILVKLKKRALIKCVNVNISSCSYDSVFYRLNIYNVKDEMKFENILREPIYIKMPKDSVMNNMSIDIQSYNVRVENDFLVTIEHIKDLGDGKINFRCKLKDKTYYRETSLGKWEIAPIGMGISVIADVER